MNLFIFFILCFYNLCSRRLASRNILLSDRGTSLRRLLVNYLIFFIISYTIQRIPFLILTHLTTEYFSRNKTKKNSMVSCAPEFLSLNATLCHRDRKRWPGVVGWGGDGRPGARRRDLRRLRETRDAGTTQRPRDQDEIRASAKRRKPVYRGWTRPRRAIHAHRITRSEEFPRLQRAALLRTRSAPPGPGSSSCDRSYVGARERPFPRSTVSFPLAPRFSLAHTVYRNIPLQCSPKTPRGRAEGRASRGDSEPRGRGALRR